MKNPRKLTRNQKMYLSRKGLNPFEYLLAKQDTKSYTFYHVKTGKLLPPMMR